MSFFERFIPVFTGDRRYVSRQEAAKRSELQCIPVGTSLEVMKEQAFFSDRVRLAARLQDPFDMVDGSRGRNGIVECVLPRNVFARLPSEEREFWPLDFDNAHFLHPETRAEFFRDAALNALAADDPRKIPKNPFRRSDSFDDAVRVTMVSDFHTSGASASSRSQPRLSWRSPFFPLDYYYRTDEEAPVVVEEEVAGDKNSRIYYCKTFKEASEVVAKAVGNTSVRKTSDPNRFVSEKCPEYVERLQKAVRRLLTGHLV